MMCPPCPPQGQKVRWRGAAPAPAPKPIMHNRVTFHISKRRADFHNKLVGQNMRDIWLNLEVGYNKHFLVEYCSRDVSDHESK